MSQISLKSISGITSITTPAGVDNQLTVHTNDTTEKLKVTSDGVNVTGVVTATELDISGDIDVDGHTNLDNVSVAGITTFNNSVTMFTDLGVSGDLDVDGHTNLDNVSISGVATVSGSSLNLATADLVFLNNNHKIHNSSSAHNVIIQGGASYAGGRIVLSGGTGTGDIRFYADSTTTPVERARIDSSGRMGLGLTPHTSDVATNVTEGLFQTDGNIDLRYAGVNSDPAGARYINFINTDTTLVSNQPMGGLHFIGNDSSNANTITASITALNSGNTGSGSHLLFKTAGSERLRILSSGNVSVANTITAGQVGLTTTNIAIRNTGVSTAYGTLIFNSDTNQLQVYTHDNIWQKCNEGVVTNTGGGTISDNANRNNYITHTFNSPGTFTTDGTITDVEVMVIGGGGGGGGRRYGAGGGAGGVIFKSGITLTGPAAIVIGSGGSSNSQNRGDAGSNSTFAAGTPLALTGKGGGGGGSYDGTGSGQPGGSGGGCTSRGNHTGGSATQPGTHSPGTDYGYRGGNYGGIGNGYASPGGGGAGGQGTDTGESNDGSTAANGGGNGGIGVQLSISGGATYYAGGGAGSIYYQVGPASGNPGPANHYGAGGNGGGGVSNSNLPGSYAGGSPPGNGAANSGGGGAGSHAQAAPYNVFSGNSGGSGGSGKVIIAYPKSTNPTVQAT